MLYLDNASTTRPTESVINMANRIMREEYFNPSNIYPQTSAIREVISRTKASILRRMGAPNGDVIFTSGGTEANNLAILGLETHITLNGKHRRFSLDNSTRFVVSDIEHSSVLKAADELSERGFWVFKLAVDKSGRVRLDLLEQWLKQGGIGLVSIMFENNEIGVFQDVNKIAVLCKEYGALFHSDCCQALAAKPIDMEAMGIDMATISAHKIGGLKGCGALVVRDSKLLQRFKGTVLGGHQQYGVRGGTENTVGIASFGVAIDELDIGDESGVSQCTMQLVFLKALMEELPGVVTTNTPLNVMDKLCPTNIMSIRFSGISGESLMLALANRGIIVSTGSACNAGYEEASHVLLAIGLSDSEAASTIRVSIPHDITIEQIGIIVNEIGNCVRVLLSLAESNV